MTGVAKVYYRVQPFLLEQSIGQFIVNYIGEYENIMIVNPLNMEKTLEEYIHSIRCLQQTLQKEIYFCAILLAINVQIILKYIC